MRNLDTSLSRKEEAFTECLGEKSALEEKNKKLQSDNFNQANDIADLQKLNVSCVLDKCFYSFEILFAFKKR